QALAEWHQRDGSVRLRSGHGWPSCRQARTTTPMAAESAPLGSRVLLDGPEREAPSRLEGWRLPSRAMDRELTELGFYTLAGAAESPRDLIAEVRQAEEMGLGAVLISERFDVKEAAALSGAVGAVSERLRIIT